MNVYNFPQKTDYTMKRSTILEQYNSQGVPSTQDRSSVSKRSSFNMISHYPPSVEQSRTPKANNNYASCNMDKIPVSNQFYHQSNYLNHQTHTYHQSYPVQQIPIHRSQPPINRIQMTQNIFNPNISKIQTFNFEQKRSKQISLQQKIQQLTQKLQKTAQQVQKHQILLTNNQNFHFNQNFNTQTQSQALAKIIQQSINQQFKLKQIENNMHTNLIRNQIDLIKTQICSYVQRDQVEQKISKISGNINHAIELINRQFFDNLNNISQVQVIGRKKQIDRLKNQIQNRFTQLQKSIQQKIKRQKEQSDKLTECSSFQSLPSKKIFVGDPIILKFVQKVSMVFKGKTKQLQEQQIVYKIDNQGYLLDSQGKYIVNSKYQQVKLSAQQLQMVREKGIIR